MTKNAAGQVIGAQLTNASDGSPFTGSVTCYVTVDGGTQAVGSVGSGACTHEGGGYHTYAPAQAETNGDLLAYQFRGTGAITVTVQVFTTAWAKSLANVPANVTQFGGSNGTFASGRPEVNTTLIEGGDATNQIRDAVVDDATRIDASALNTLSGHDPGEAIMGATDLGTGSGLTSLATAAELAKVPKSDGTASWNATALAAINAQADTALSDYDPPTKAELDAAVSPLATAAALATVDSNVDALVTRLIALAITTGAVVDDAANTAATFETDLSETADDHWVGSYLLITSGDLVGQVRRITAYNGTTKFVTTDAFTAEPASSVTFAIINR